MTREEMRERVAQLFCGGCNPCDACFKDADAAIAIIRGETLEEAARVAEGPVYRTSGTGEVSIRGTDKGNWSVPMPISGFPGSDYGTGRYDAAAAIRALKDQATT